MTFTLPRFGRRAATTQPAQLFAQPTTATPAEPLHEDVLMEVVLPEGRALPQVEGWTLRLWPQARLGDATLQAHADDGSLSLASLTAALSAQGVMTLGLVRRRAA
ncbi:hypothetical protein EHF33_02405 [Deinococcus psychrotolerans]|uniref:Uncharacterized protein n=1 Tax=Deinococcus psychrotolerans TaxID=2489213 RepID=A0A3G8Y8N2_9DEIO|nr:hypothetical protein [Deinococcus psychrotolerans]AZI41739.1 hypothetical protein EHF33_02405 [Deinococcus psychrotolerans]